MSCLTRHISFRAWISFKVSSNEVELEIYKDPRKTNWDPILGSLMENLTLIVEITLGKLETALLTAYGIACPLRKVWVQRSRFWSKELEKLRKKSRLNLTKL